MLSSPMIERVAFLGISWYSIIIVSSLLIGIVISRREAVRYGFSPDVIIDYTLWAIPLGILFARIYYVFFRFNIYSDNLLRFFDIREGGLAIYGGILGGMLAARIVSKRRKIEIGRLLDSLAPSLVLGQALGRWGNYINMEAFGLRVNEAELQFFPLAVEIPVGNIWYWQLATFFYEFCYDIAVFFILWFAIRPNKKKTGDIFLWYILLYCSGRTVIEGLRSDSLTFISDFVRISQVLSALASLVIVVIFFYRIRDSISIVTILPLIGSILAITETFLGEFERNAYSDLFVISQAGLLVLFLSLLITLIIWTLDCGHFDIKCFLMLVPDMIFYLFLFVYGLGRINEDNTYYVTFRQIASMLQVILSGYLLCYRFFPGALREKGPQIKRFVIHG